MKHLMKRKRVRKARQEAVKQFRHAVINMVEGLNGRTGIADEKRAFEPYEATIQTECGPLTVYLTRYDKGDDGFDVFFKFKGDLKEAISRKLPGLNHYSGKWNFHLTGGTDDMVPALNCLLAHLRMAKVIPYRSKATMEI